MTSDGRPGPDELLFLPLGGAGEIGMNLNLYGHAGKWLMVDLGVTFGDEATPGIEVIMPDPRFIEERREDLVGIYARASVFCLPCTVASTGDRDGLPPAALTKDLPSSNAFASS